MSDQEVSSDQQVHIDPAVREEAYERVVATTSDTVRDIVKDVIKRTYEEGEQTLPRTASAPKLNEPLLYEDVDRPSEMAIPGGFRRNYIIEQEEQEVEPVDSVMQKQDSFLDALLRSNSTYLYTWVVPLAETDDDIPDTPRMLFTRQPSETNAELDKHLAGDRKTMITLFKSYVATGILFLPSGFKAAGLVAAVTTVFVVGILNLYCVSLLLQTKKFFETEHGVSSDRAPLLRGAQVAGQSAATLSQLGYLCMGETGKYLVEFSTFFSQVGFCCVYFSFGGNTVNNAFGLSIPLEQFCVAALFILTPLTYIRHLKYFAVPNLIGAVFVVFSLFLLCVKAVITVSTRDESHKLDWSCANGGVDSACLWINREGFLAFFGTAVYIFEGTTMVLPIQRSMKHPERLERMTRIVMLTLTLLFCIFGALNFYAYGQETGLIILSNLPHDEAVVISSMFIVVAIFMFPLMIFPAANIIEKHLFAKERRSGKKWEKNGIRTLLVIFCACVSVGAGKQVDEMVAVIGGLFCVPLALVYPPLFFLTSGCARDPLTEKGPALLTLLFGVGSALVSSASAIEAFAKDKS